MFNVFSEVLRTVSETAKIPVVIILVLLLALTVILIGWTIVEGFTERRRLKVKLPALLDELREGRPEDVARCIRRSGLLISMKETLIEVTRHPSFTPAMLESLADSQLDMEQQRYDRILKITDTIAKIAPMIGLLGTLIPLGPGIIALGQGDTLTLSESLLTAFDTTVAGLISAAVCLMISIVRRSWYNEYMTILETVMDCVVEIEKEMI